MTTRKKGRIGTAFDEFLATEGILRECEEQAIKQILTDASKEGKETAYLLRSPANAQRLLGSIEEANEGRVRTVKLPK